MKSLGKLKRFGLNKSDGKEKRVNQPSALLNDLAQASQDMQDMRNCYDSLLSAAAATANSAYEFSESLRDMGTCLLEKTAVNEDDECSKVLSVLGNVQFELQKLVDSYRSHVVLTITSPSESLLSELRTVEEMKRQCDEKRNLYEYMVAQQREKGKSKSAKEEVFTSQELQATHDEYDEEATLCIFRLKSLKQGQCRSLLTQAARHHAAQLNFFRKGLKSLEALDPYIRVVAEKQHIDYQVSGFGDEDDGKDEVVNSLENDDDGELSFDYRLNKQGQDAVSTSKNSMEVDQVHLPRPQASTVENAEVFLIQSRGEQIFNRDHRIAHSAPIFSAKKFDPAERVREMQPSSARKSYSYVLPTPGDAKSSISSRTSSSALQSRPTNHSGCSQSLWHSSPLEPDNRGKNFVDDKLSVQLPPFLAQGFSFPQFDAHNADDAKKFKRQAFSGPLTNKPMLTKPALSASSPITPTELPQLVSGVLSRAQIAHPTSSPPIASSPKINELHELPRPPAAFASKTVSSSSEHSAPLAFRNQELSPTNKTPSGAFSTAPRLPTPPLIIPRCYSIPSTNQRAAALHAATLLRSSQLPEKSEEVASPPLAPISLSSVEQLPTVSATASHFGKIHGN